MWYRLWLLTGLTLLAVSLFKLKQSVDFLSRSERTIGQVIMLEESDDAYAPVFAVATRTGEPVIYHHPAATSPASWRVGEQATFLYDPADPESVTMLGYFWLFSWAIVLMGIAIPLLVISIGYYLLKPLTRMPDYIFPGGKIKSID